MGNPWLSLMMQVGNKAGVIPSAPQGLQNLKEAIKGVPFQLLQKGMSGIMDINNIMQGVAQFSQQLGSLSQLGQFGNLFGQFQGLAQNINGIATLNTNILSSRLSVDDLVAAMGPNQAMMAGLTQFAPVVLLQQLNTDSGQAANSNITNVNDSGMVGANNYYGNNFPNTGYNAGNTVIYVGNNTGDIRTSTIFGYAANLFSNSVLQNLPANTYYYLLSINGRTTTNPNPNGISSLSLLANSLGNVVSNGQSNNILFSNAYAQSIANGFIDTTLNNIIITIDKNFGKGS